MRRFTVALVVILISELTILGLTLTDLWYPLWYYRVTQSTLFPFLPPLVGGLVVLFVRYYLQRAGQQKEKREREEEKRRERDALLANIRAELDQNMILIADLFNPVKVGFIRRGDLSLSERLRTQTWDSCINSGQVALLGFEERREIADVYDLIGDYNKRDWEHEDNLRREKTLYNLRERIQRLVQEESFWPPRKAT